MAGGYTFRYPDAYSDSYRVWGAENREIIGYATFVAEPSGSEASWRFVDVFVVEQCRGKDIATAVFTAGLHGVRIPPDGPLAINLPVQHPAQGLLRKVLKGNCLLVMYTVQAFPMAVTLDWFLKSPKSRQFLR